MKNIKKFEDWFLYFTGFCDKFSDRVMEGGFEIEDFSSVLPPNLNIDYYNNIKRRHPDVIRVFALSLHRSGAEVIQFFLMSKGQVIVEYCNAYIEVQKTVAFKNPKELYENTSSFINYLTTNWNPIK